VSPDLVIRLVRHGESAANIGKYDPQNEPDFLVPLTERGHAQARAVGATLGRETLAAGLLYSSPYLRARETLRSILDGAGIAEGERAALRIYEDPRLREVDHGYESVEAQEAMRARHGWFYYRFKGGESPADCFDRTSSFLESMMRQVERKSTRDVLIVTHGLTIRCFVMRFLHLSVEEFDRLANPENCCVVTIGPKDRVGECLFTRGKWGVSGLKTRT
jgi:broad specificity phosphatase PhoE